MANIVFEAVISSILGVNSNVVVVESLMMNLVVKIDENVAILMEGEGV